MLKLILHKALGEISTEDLEDIFHQLIDENPIDHQTIVDIVESILIERGIIS